MEVKKDALGVQVDCATIPKQAVFESFHKGSLCSLVRNVTDKADIMITVAGL